MAHYAEFLEGLMTSPRAVSAPTPSGPALATRIASLVNIHRRGVVVELGPGTGAVTQALLDRGLSPDRLVAVEYVSCFANLLRRRFPGAQIVEGDAFAFADYLPQGCEVGAVVSGIPLLNFPPARRAKLIEAALERCGSFIQLSYGWMPPVRPGPGVTLEKFIVWRNLPPAHVWKYGLAG